MMSLFEKMIGVRIPCDYAWDDEGIVRIGAGRNVAAYVGGDFKGKCIIFLHGNGETAVSEKCLFDQLNERGVSVVAPYPHFTWRASVQGTCVAAERVRACRRWAAQ